MLFLPFDSVRFSSTGARLLFLCFSHVPSSSPFPSFLSSPLYKAHSPGKDVQRRNSFLPQPRASPAGGLLRPSWTGLRLNFFCAHLSLANLVNMGDSAEMQPTYLPGPPGPNEWFVLLNGVVSANPHQQTRSLLPIWRHCPHHTTTSTTPTLFAALPLHFKHLPLCRARLSSSQEVYQFYSLPISIPG